MIYLTVLKMSIFFYGHRPGAVLKVPSYRLFDSDTLYCFILNLPQIEIALTPRKELGLLLILYSNII